MLNLGMVIGLIKSLAPGVDPAVIEQAVADWLDAHPEATTTVQDGSITEAKLASDVLAELGEIEGLKEAIVPIDGLVDLNDLDSDFEGLLHPPYSEDGFLMGALILSNGNIRTGNDGDRNYTVSPLIPVKPNSTIAVYVPNGKTGTTIGQIATTNNGYGVFGSDGTTPVAKVSFTEITSTIFSIKIPATAYYIRFVMYSGYNNSGTISVDKFQRAVAYFNASWQVIESESTTLTTDDFDKKPNGSIHLIKRNDGSYLTISASELSEKKILVFGDSIWGNDRSTGVDYWLKDFSGATIYNCAIGGTLICGGRAGSAAWLAFDAPNLIHAKLTDTWTDQDEYVDDVASYVKTETLPLLKSVDMTKVDVVILAYGTNDFSNHSTSAIKTAYKTVIDEILTAYPKIRILVCCPPWRMINDNDADTYENTSGETMRQMDSGIVDMAREEHVAVINMFEELPWRALTKGIYLSSDEVHPTPEGSKVYAHVIHGKLRSMY